VTADDSNDIAEDLLVRRGKRLRKAGILVLLAGVAGAGLVYWLGSRTPNPGEDASMIGFDKAEQRQMGELYGNWGTMIEGFQDDLKSPGTQASIILVVAGVIAAGCFYLAEPPAGDDEASSGSNPPRA
jgi:hypothetical protein